VAISYNFFKYFSIFCTVEKSKKILNAFQTKISNFKYILYKFGFKTFNLFINITSTLKIKMKYEYIFCPEFLTNIVFTALNL